MQRAIRHMMGRERMVWLDADADVRIFLTSTVLTADGKHPDLPATESILLRAMSKRRIRRSMMLICWSSVFSDTIHHAHAFPTAHYNASLLAFANLVPPGGDH